MIHVPLPRGARRPAGAALLLSLLAIALPDRVFAQAHPAPAAVTIPARPRHRTIYSNVSAIRQNPIGVQDAAKLAWQYRLFDSEHLLLRDSFVGVSFQPIFTPALVRLGAAVDAQPFAMLHVEARAEYLNFFGASGHLRSFADAGADFSDTAIKTGKSSAYATSGWQATLQAELRAKVRAVVVRSKLQFAQVNVDLQGDDGYWYDAYQDLLLPRRGWFLVNDADVLWLRGRLVAGLRHSLAVVEDRAGTGEAAGNTPTQRLGPLLAWSFWDEPGRTFDKPTILLLVQWHLQHRYRTGEDVSQAMPYIALGFAFRGDLLP